MSSTGQRANGITYLLYCFMFDSMETFCRPCSLKTVPVIWNNNPRPEAHQSRFRFVPNDTQSPSYCVMGLKTSCSVSFYLLPSVLYLFSITQFSYTKPLKNTTTVFCTPDVGDFRCALIYMYI